LHCEYSLQGRGDAIETMFKSIAVESNGPIRGLSKFIVRNRPGAVMPRRASAVK